MTGDDEIEVMFLREYEGDLRKTAILIQERILDVFASHHGSHHKKFNEKLLALSVGISTIQNNFMFNIFEDSVQHLTSAGILQWMMIFYREYFFPPSSEDPKGPQVLKVDDLSFGFEIWLIASAFALTAFVIEASAKHILKIMQNFVVLISFLFGYKKFRRDIKKFGL